MYKKITAFILLISIVLTMVGCGNAPTASPSYDSTQENNNASEPTTETLIKEEKDQSEESKDIIQEDTVVNGFDADFNVYNTYEPNEKILNIVLSDGAYIQIGNTVLEIGKSTLRDLVNAGMDMYATTAKYNTYYGHRLRDEKLNNQLIDRFIGYLKEHEGRWGGTGFLSGDFSVDFYSMGRSLVDGSVDDPIIDSIKIQPYAGNSGVVKDFLYGEPKYKDINSIYITGGIKFTGPVSTVKNDYATLKWEVNEVNDLTGHLAWNKFYYTDCVGTPYRYEVQLLSAEDHISSLLIRLYE